MVRAVRLGVAEALREDLDGASSHVARRRQPADELRPRDALAHALPGDEDGVGARMRGDRVHGERAGGDDPGAVRVEAAHPATLLERHRRQQAREPV